MALVLTEEQELIQQTAREFVSDKSPVAELRRLRDERDPVGYSETVWKELADLGFAGIPFPEALGGAGMGYAELGVVLEELGRTLTATPMLSTVLLAGNAVLLAGNETQQKDLIPGICQGERVLALAFQETARFDPWAIRTQARRDGGAWVLSGEKRFVLDGHVASTLVVAARSAGSSGERDGITLFLVDPASPGVSVTRTLMVDSHNAARVELRDVRVEGSAVLGTVDAAADVLEPVFDRATIGLSAEMLGGIQEAFDRTIEYLKQRKQFGVPIGSFQALKHRAAEWFCEVELSRSIVLDALRAIDEERPDLPQLASVCKARVSDAFVHSGEEGVQLFAGIGMTDEEEIGFFLKRARAAELTLGDAVYHRDRYATLEGY